MARPENRSEARALSLTLPVEAFNYLALLASLGKLGRTVARVMRLRMDRVRAQVRERIAHGMRRDLRMHFIERARVPEEREELVAVALAQQQRHAAHDDEAPRQRRHAEQDE